MASVGCRNVACIYFRLHFVSIFLNSVRYAKKLGFIYMIWFCCHNFLANLKSDALNQQSCLASCAFLSLISNG